MAVFCFTLLRPESSSFTKRRHLFFCYSLHYYSPISVLIFRSKLKNLRFFSRDTSMVPLVPYYLKKNTTPCAYEINIWISQL